MENNESLQGLKIGFAFTGSFCTFKKAFATLEELKSSGADITGIMSENASRTDTRFGNAKEHIKHLEDITGKPVILTIAKAEPIGPTNMFDLLLVAPCTGNTAAKLASSIVDSTVTMAVKSHLRNGKPVVLAICTNDALAGAAKNISALRNTKNFTILPMYQDDPVGKPYSLVTDFSTILSEIKKIKINKI